MPLNNHNFSSRSDHWKEVMIRVDVNLTDRQIEGFRLLHLSTRRYFAKDYIDRFWHGKSAGISQVKFSYDLPFFGLHNDIIMIK